MSVFLEGETLLVLPVSPMRRVVEQAQQALRQSGYGPLRRLVCGFDQGVLTLHGAVSSFYLKQMAQTIVRKATGPMTIIDRIDVVECRPITTSTEAGV